MRVLFLCEVNARTAAFGEVCEFIVYCDTVCFKREKFARLLYIVIQFVLKGRSVRVYCIL